MIRLWEVEARVRETPGAMATNMSTTVRATSRVGAIQRAQKIVSNLLKGEVLSIEVLEVLPEMTDDELIDYCEIHCGTERALFHVSHVERMYRLAGQEHAIPKWLPSFVSVHPEQMMPLVEAARKRPSAWDRVSEGMDGMRPTSWEHVIKEGGVS
jgi:hypothetical protein